MDTIPSPDPRPLDIPGLSDLLVSAYRFKDPQRTADAAANVHQPTVNGIRGIGLLLWWAAQNDEFGASKQSREAIGDVGLLLEMLGDLADATSIIGSNATGDRRAANG